MTESSNAGRDRRPRRKRSIFAPDEVVHLSESSLARDDYLAFSAGHRIAVWHRIGVVHKDLHSKHMFIDPYTGMTTLIDFGAADLSWVVDPDRMFQDIVMVRQTMGQSWTRGFLAGYARTSHLLTDPEHPGFTDAVLARAGGQIGSIARPAQPVFTDADCVTLLTPVLDLSSGFPRLTGDLPDAVVSPEDLTIVRCALLMAEVGAAEQLLTERPPKSAVGRLLSALEKGTRREEKANLLGARMAALRVFDTTGNDPAVLRCLAGMTDIYDWLAGRLDRPAAPIEPAFVNCVHAAQLSLELLQHRAWPVTELESQELKVTSRHRHLTWYAPMLNAPPDDERYRQLVNYLASRVTLYEAMFRESWDPEEGASSRLWSANWRALVLARTALHTYLHALRSGTVVEASEETTIKTVKALAGLNAGAVRSNRSAAMNLHGWIALAPGVTPLSEYYVRFTDELLEAYKVISLIDTERPDLAQLAASEQVSAVLARGPVHGDDFDALMAWGIAPDD
ncbi:hypothetical protein AB0H94_35220 [Streptomyces purpurascens]|uniref:hypothetical protein n=1 Tax=Streptomyces purpurascens TaxID=1924 RepID=UPI00341049BD